ncbi:MAG: Spy/CpxP family protein refolding chaperone [Gammaproteobacteria bacterium]|nr:Spy/CpxP family protein refolding chaperone [Gammaproteobacteria bacterium]
MKRGTKWLVGAAFVAAGTLGAGALYANQHIAEGGYMHKQFGGHHGKGRMMRKLCSESRDEHIEDVINVVENFVEMTPDQQAAWGSLTDEVRASSARVDAACEELQATGRPSSLPQRLAVAETLMGAGYDVVQRLRPQFDAFYATLDADQQAALERMAKHRRHRRG